MKNSKIHSTFIAAIVATLVSGGALAANPTFTDSNGDGVISIEEINTAFDAMKATALEQYDANGDGELSRAERKAHKKDKRAERVAQFDTDGDGELSRSERRTAKEARHAAIDAQLDVNQDGLVSDAEAAGFEQFRDERSERKHGKKNGHKKNRNDDQA